MWPQNTKISVICTIDEEFPTKKGDKLYYEDHYKCWPLPLFTIIITLVELAFFVYYSVANETVNLAWLKSESVFVYRPDKRLELWRFVSYALLHVDLRHLVSNLVMNLCFGLPLEMIHGNLRIGVVYMAGVLAGSLGTSIFNNNLYLMGTSAGIYALLAAQLADILLNHNNMTLPIVRFIGIFLIASTDVGITFYYNFKAKQLCQPYSVSFLAHLSGALAGLTIGLCILKNFDQQPQADHKKIFRWIAITVYAVCMFLAIMYNVIHSNYL